MGLPAIRPLGFLIAASAVVGLGLDAGSVALTRLAIDRDVLEAGQAAAEAVEGLKVDQRSATVALQAAAERGREDGLKIRTKSFRLHQDGRVELTGVRTAPTLLLELFDALRHYTKVRSTLTVEARPFT